MPDRPVGPPDPAPQAPATRVLVVDDSRLVRTVLREILEVDPGIRVVGEAANGAEGVQRCLALEPDIVLMDVQMPVMDGLEAVERIMAERPTPVIILSATVQPGEVKSAFRAVRAGAFEALAKPERLADAVVAERLGAELRSRVQLYARAGRRRGWGGRSAVGPAAREAVSFPARSGRVLALGASTGGPRVVQALLAALPREFPCPVFVVQHISIGFARGFAQWLQRETPLEVRVLSGRERPRPGVVYLPPDDRHLALRRGLATLEDGPALNGCRPSVDVLFRSLAREVGAAAVAVLLTGMGRDGAAGALEVARAGGQVIAQDEATSVIFGMPRVAIELGAATRVVADRDLPAAVAAALAGAV